MEKEMTDEEQRELAVDAALAFMAAEPTFIAIPENSRLIVEYIEAHAELDPTTVSTYRQAFHASRARLRFEHHMSGDEYRQKVVIPVFQKRQREKPKLSETDALLKDIFESHKFRDSLSNRAKVDRYMREHGIVDYSPENLSHAINTVAEHPGLEPSDAAITAMPSSELKKYIEREFKEQQAKNPPKTSDKPFGVNWSNWLNGR
jgi:hypothetical protein